MDDDDIDLGPCCGCGATGADVRNIVMLDVKAPEPGKGWGCVVCGLPMDGAYAVMCDVCIGLSVEPREVVAGYMAEKRRVRRARCIERFAHDATKHTDEIDATEKIA